MTEIQNDPIDGAEDATNAAPTPVKTPRRKFSLREMQDDVPFTAAGRRSPDREGKAIELAKACARIADDNRAKEILLLDLRGGTPLVDFFVIATAASRRQGNSIAIEVDQEMKRIGEKKLGVEGSEEGRWTLIDYGDFVVHVFSEEARKYYGLEEIWGDAIPIDWHDADHPARPAAEPEVDAPTIGDDDDDEPDDDETEA